MAMITYQIDGDVALIGLNRPDKRNAVSDPMVKELEAAVDKASSEALAAVIHGHGDHFCAGLDLAEHVHRDVVDAVHHSRHWHGIFDKIRRGKIPFVAALHGAVIGGGFELAAATHIRVADPSTVFALPEGQRGIFTGGSGSVGIARLIGLANMTDMMLTGRAYKAEDAKGINAFQYLVESGQSLSKATELAATAAKNAPLSNYAVIHALPRIQDMGSDDGLFVESLISAITTGTDDARDRLNDFLQGRAKRIIEKDD